MLRFLTSGESHGKALITIIEGVPAGLYLDEIYIANQLKRRQAGYGRSQRMSIEHDAAEIISGVRHGFTIGSPVSLYIKNREWENWQRSMSAAFVDGKIERVTHPRPGHADLAGVLKYNFNDIRPVLERASARETASRVAAGAVARKLLEEFNIEIRSHTLAIGGVYAAESSISDWDRVEKSPLRIADHEVEIKMMELIDRVKTAGDTVGGIFEVVVTGLPPGLGSYTHWDRRLDGRIAAAVMSINAVKGVEIGDGFKLAGLKGSEAQDAIIPAGEGSQFGWKRSTNHCGGIEGGMSNGEPVLIRAAIKPVPTLGSPLPSIDLDTGEEVKAHFERSDICVVPSGGVIAESMLALVLVDAFLEKFGGDHIEELRRNYDSYIQSLKSRMKA